MQGRARFPGSSAGRRRHREWVLVEHRPAHHAGVAVRGALPKAVAEHSIRGGIRTVRVGRVEEAPVKQLDPEHVEIVLGCFDKPAAPHLSASSRAGANTGAVDAVGGQVGEGAVLIAEILVVRVGLRSGGGRVSTIRAVQEDDLLALGYGQRLDDQRVQHGKYHRVRAYAERQREWALIMLAASVVRRNGSGPMQACEAAVHLAKESGVCP